MRDWDLIVIGAGVLGSFHAWFAAKRGWRTLLLERHQGATQASVRNFGMICPSGMKAGDWQHRGQESVRHYRELLPQLSLPFSAPGTIYLATNELELAVLEEYPTLPGREGARLIPGKNLPAPINQQTCLAGLLCLDDVRFNSREFFPSFHRYLSEISEIELRPQTTAIQVEETTNGVLVRDSRGESYRARQVIICSGSDLQTLFPEKLQGIRSCLLHMYQTAPVEWRLGSSLASGWTIHRYPAFHSCPSWKKLDEAPRPADLVEHGIHILVVQNADGSLVLGDSHHDFAGDVAHQMDSQVEQLIIQETSRLLEGSPFRIDKRWLGVYPVDPQGDLFRESIGGKIHLVTGIGGKGMTTGPAVARETIDLIAESW